MSKRVSWSIARITLSDTCQKRNLSWAREIPSGDNASVLLALLSDLVRGLP